MMEFAIMIGLVGLGQASLAWVAPTDFSVGSNHFAMRAFRNQPVRNACPCFPWFSMLVFQCLFSIVGYWISSNSRLDRRTSAGNASTSFSVI